MNYTKLADRLELSLECLIDYLNNRSILVFESLDDICKFYSESGIDNPTKFLKRELKDGSVIYTQNKFFLFA